MPKYVILNKFNECLVEGDEKEELVKDLKETLEHKLDQNETYSLFRLDETIEIELEYKATRTKVE